MNTPYITAILAITSLSFSAGATEQDMSQSEFAAAEKNIVAEYKSAKASCDPFSSSDKELCIAAAKHTKKIARAELNARYKLFI